MDNNSMAIRKLKFHMAGRNPQIVPCLVGPTGIGKTAIVNQVARDLGAELVYFNMAQQNQGDNALPVPHINAGQTLVQYALHHKVQEILDNPHKDFIVMCDELGRGQIPVLSEWMTLLNERQIQGHKFNNNVRFIAAMNPSSTMKGYEDTDYITTEMDPAHLTRFHFGYDAGPLFATMIWDAIESIPLSKVMSDKPVSQQLINRFKNNTLQKQIITVDSWLAEMKERNIKFMPQHVANFIAFWETMKSDDAKTKVGYAITRDFLVPDLNAPNKMKPDCIANLFYFGDGTYNRSFVEFMDKALSVANVKVS